MISSAGILFGVLAIVYLSIREVNIVVAAPLATIIIVVSNHMDIVTAMLGVEKNNYMGALGSYIMNYFAVFLLGSILAKLMETSGATVSIADYIMSKVGVGNPFRVLVAIFVVSFVLTYGGISLFVVMFAVLPLAKTLFQKMNLSWNLIQVPLWLGIGTVTMTMLPGTPAIQNVIPIQYLDTSLTAAFLPSILGSIGCIVFGLIYMNYVLKRSLKKGEDFGTYTASIDSKQIYHSKPSFVKSIFPLVLLILITISGSLAGSDYLRRNIIYIALIVAILLSLILFNSFISDKINTISIGGKDSISPIFSTASAVAFGAVVMSADGFNIFADMILRIPGSPLFSLTFLSAFMSAITGSTSGALGIIMPNFAEYYLSLGVNPEMLHRVAAVSANITTIVPQGGAYLTFLAISGLKFKNSFKDTFIVVSIGSIISNVIIIIVGAFLY
ncbi:GntP family permease [Enterococcus hulanensis]|uniref:GntP family permease n=1 Tax=Enterococcus hulanensis TaxID=2559929 RepID=UPI00288C90FF|nr:GntP family permease [Enterococcus hulanensis]MDT2659260.1 GntP family permease [Enterococcus hulanensis]